MYNNPTRLLVLRKMEIRRKRGNGVKKAENVYVVLTAPANGYLFGRNGGPFLIKVPLSLAQWIGKSLVQHHWVAS
jgi:hypothetical protein